MRRLEMTVFAVTLFASVLTTNIVMAQNNACNARCVAYQTGVQTQFEIDMKLRRYKSGTILLKDFGMVNGSSVSQLQAACQSLSANYMETLPKWTPMGDQAEVKLAESISIDLSDDLKVVIQWQEKTTCQPLQ